MLLNFNKILKFFVTSLLFFFSIYFLIHGYNLIKSNFLKINLNSNSNQDNNNTFNSKIVIENINENNLIKNEIKSKLSETEKQSLNEIIIKVKKNDTFGKIINNFIKNNRLKNKIINKLEKIYNLKNLKIDQEIFFYADSDNIIKKILLPIDFSTDIMVNIINEEVAISKSKIDLIKEINSKKILIKNSLYESGIESNLPLTILSNLIRLLSFDVDFQRDIQKNNELEISYEIFYNEKRKSISYGDIKYIKLNFKNNFIEYFAFITEENYLDYFNAEGKNVKKALLKTPIDGAKLSSSYGIRKHPISGYNKMHKGVDFAAPIGTPIYAGGNGIIEFVGTNGGYGKYIRIRHNGSYKTAYAHLNSFKKGIYKGARVNQGETIGYVGTTGKSTGPHLHYEIIYQNKQINPMKIKLPSGKILKGKELEKFKKESKKIYSDYLFYLYE